MALERYTDEQLRGMLRSGSASTHLHKESTLADKIRLLQLVAEDTHFSFSERQTAVDHLALLRRLARLRRGRHRALVE